MTAPWLGNIRQTIEEGLEAHFARKLAEARELSEPGLELAGGVMELTMRGGKRLRPAVAFAGAQSITPRVSRESIRTLGVALEILQTYLLVHDDWMDSDTCRRGGPTLHTSYTRSHGDPHLGASLAVLAGDLAHSMAWELMDRCEFPPARQREARQTFARMCEEVVYGQHLDLIADPDVSRIHNLKTAGYTVRGPLQLGALMSNASRPQLAALERFGRPAGLAFQTVDDLLGTFGDASRVGKPVGGDLRRGKRTSLIAAAEATLEPNELGQLREVWGNPDASDREISSIASLLERRGIRAQVVRQLEQLRAQARTALRASNLPNPKPLQELLDALCARRH